ncbi:DUF1214 domain-containing protein [Taklimakanibacter lacteus]|uniref:DUF1214 domain-containing protein n=1 Tax=Taklimakanibacter lacteus TaxID=2268456 RepID=UPI000E66B5BC
MRLGSLIKGVGVLFLGGIIGIVSAQWSVEKTATAMTAGGGPWKSWFSGTTSIRNPYVNAHYLMFGRLPPTLGQELLFEARYDDEGAALDASCDYVIEGPRLTARWWHLALADEDNSQPAAISLTSSQLIGEPDGSMRITISRQPKAGNWINPRDLSRFELVLKLRPGSGLNAGAAVVTLPHIRREACT